MAFAFPSEWQVNANANANAYVLFVFYLREFVDWFVDWFVDSLFILLPSLFGEG